MEFEESPSFSLKRWIFGKISRKFTLIFTIIAILATFIGGFIFYSIAIADTYSQVQANLENAAQSRANHVKTFLEDQKSAVEVMAQSVVFRDLLRMNKSNPDYDSQFQKIQKRMLDTLNASPVFYEDFLMDKNGIILVSSTPSNLGLNKSNDEYFIEGKKGVYIKDLYFSNTTGLYNLVISAPLFDSNNNLLGVYAARMNIQEITKILADRTGLGKTGEIFLLDSDNLLMLTPSIYLNDTILKFKIDTVNSRHCAEDIKLYESQLTKNPNASFNPAPFKAMVFKDYRGVSVLGTHSFLIPVIDWCVIAKVDESEAIGTLRNKMIFNFFLIALLIVLIVALAVFIVSKRVTKPISELTEATEKLRNKDFKVRVNIKSGDEIEQLGKSFNETMDVLENIEEERKQIDKAKTEFLSITSHELRSPMTPMKAQLQMLLAGYFGKLTKQQKESMQIVLSNTERLDRIIVDFLEISRIEAARLKFNFIRTNLLPYIERLVEETKNYAPEKNIHFDVNIEKMPTFEVDPDRVMQVLRNLLNNAVKFSKDEGRIYFDSDYYKPFNVLSLAAKTSRGIIVNASFLSSPATEELLITVSESKGISSSSSKNSTATLITTSGNQPYLYQHIESVPLSVALKAQTITFSGYIRNLVGDGNLTKAAYNVNLNWSLPSGFVVGGGNATKSFTLLLDNSVHYNLINISLDSSSLPTMSPGTYTVYLVSQGYNQSGSLLTMGTQNMLSDSSTIVLSCSNESDGIIVSACGSLDGDYIAPAPVVRIETTGGGGGGGAGGGATIVPSQIFEVVRGQTKSFELEVTNKNLYATLNNIQLLLAGYPEKYITIEPAVIDSIAPKQTQKFKITINSPTYSDFEKLALNATIYGNYIDTTGSKTSYSERRNLLLVVNEVSKTQVSGILGEAEKAIQLMEEKGYNIDYVNNLLNSAYDKQKIFEYKSALDLANQIIELQKNAEQTDSLIRRIVFAMRDPSDESILTGKVMDSSLLNIPLAELLVEKNIFSSQESSDLINLAIAAFQRGDYALAQERAKSAMAMVLNERRGNILLFVYLYWNYLVLFAILFGFLAILGYKKYKQSSINEKITDLIKEGENIKNLKKRTQENYFGGKISINNYKIAMDNYETRLAFITKMRIKLRTRRIKLLKPEKILENLEKERKQVEDEIKTIQVEFYKKGKVAKTEYESEFLELNERLAEIEDERVTALLLKEKSKKRFGLFYYIRDYFYSNKKLDELEIKKEIERIIENHGKK